MFVLSYCQSKNASWHSDRSSCILVCASCSLTEYHSEDPGSIWFTSSLQIRKYIYELPPVGQTVSDLLNGTKADRLMNFLFKKPSHYMLQSTVKVDEHWSIRNICICFICFIKRKLQSSKVECFYSWIQVSSCGKKKRSCSWIRYCWAWIDRVWNVTLDLLP